MYKVSKIIAGVALIAGSFGFMTAAGAATRIAGVTGTYGTIPAVVSATECVPSGIQAWVGVESATWNDVVFARAYYNQWHWSGTAWIYMGWAWMNNGNWTKGSTYLPGQTSDEFLVATANVANGYQYTVTYEILVRNANGNNLAHQYYTSSAGEYMHNITQLSTAYCTAG